MSQRNKLIILGVLVVLVGILAYFQLLQPKPHAAVAAPPAAPGLPPALAAADSGAKAAANGPADAAQDQGPSADDLRQLADWFGVLRPTGPAIVKGRVPVLGMSWKAPLAQPDQPSQGDSQTPWMTEPGKLDGIVKVGNGPGRALFQGELYQVGERLRGTTYTIVSIGDDSVTLKSDDRVITRFWHD